MVRGGLGRLELADVADVGEDALVVHDAKRDDPGLAFELAHLPRARLGATPIGVFRDVERPVYGEDLARELEGAARRSARTSSSGYSTRATPGPSPARLGRDPADQLGPRALMALLGAEGELLEQAVRGGCRSTSWR